MKSSLTQSGTARNPPAIPLHETASETPAGQFIRRFWQPIFVSAGLLPGQAKPLHILDDRFTLYRGQSGAVHLVDYRCRHRGTQLSTGWVEGEDIRCLYHGWKYGPDGQCLERPAERTKGIPGSIRIRSFAVREYLGLIFGYVGPGNPPAFPRFLPLEDKHIDVYTYDRDCNYFQNLENGVDEVHVNFTHNYGIYKDAGLAQEIPDVKARETDYGMIVLTRRGTEDKLRETHFLMPNATLMRLPPRSRYEKDWWHYLVWRVPVDREVHRTFGLRALTLDPRDVERFELENRARAERCKGERPWRELARDILAGRTSLGEIGEHSELINIQDYVTQVGQGAIADRDNETLGSSDAAVALLRRIWEREIRAMRDGGQLKEWRIPESLCATVGL